MAKPRLPIALVVDDDTNMQRWAAALLQQGGFRPVAAADAMTGLMLVRSSKPDVVVLDLGLPGGGGKLFLERLRKIAGFTKLPVIVMSGRITEETPRELAPLGVTVLLQKPVEAERFVAAVRAAIEPADPASA